MEVLNEATKKKKGKEIIVRNPPTPALPPDPPLFPDHRWFYE